MRKEPASRGRAETGKVMRCFTRSLFEFAVFEINNSL
jgi:hypothetical protein